MDCPRKLKHPKTPLYRRDVSDHLSQVLHSTETNRELVADLRDYCFAELGFNQNETMKVLTIVASVFISLSFFVGLYGMDFDSTVPDWNLSELKWKFGYLITLAMMAGVVILSLGGLWRLNRMQRASRTRRFTTTRRVFPVLAPLDVADVPSLADDLKVVSCD